MIVLNNKYQVHPEPSMQQTWYSTIVTNVESVRTYNTTSRYKNKRRLTLLDGTTFIEFIRHSMLYLEEHDTDQYYFVMASKKQRPDILSLDLLGVSTFYWVILANNHLASPLQMKNDLTLRVPSLTRVINNEKMI